MNLIRVRLIAYAIAVLVCQAAALSAAPVALCRGALSAADDLDECCKNLGPGQTCPMHHKTHDAENRGPAWTCVCSPSDAVLASLVGVSGALPEPVRVPDPATRVAVLVAVPPSTLDHQQPPNYPPPRVSSNFSRAKARPVPGRVRRAEALRHGRG
jgi:hypothetical protein